MATDRWGDFIPHTLASMKAAKASGVSNQEIRGYHQTIRNRLRESDFPFDDLLEICDEPLEVRTVTFDSKGREIQA